jgi:hypothetical protein
MNEHSSAPILIICGFTASPLPLRYQWQPGFPEPSTVTFSIYTVLALYAGVGDAFDNVLLGADVHDDDWDN